MKTLLPLLLLSAFQAAAATYSVTLAWDASKDSTVTGYSLYWTDLSTGSLGKNTVGNVTTNTVGGLEAARQYSFYCVAYNAGGVESVPSNTVNYKTPTPPPPTNAPPPVPAAPTSLRNTLVNPHRIDLTWNGDRSAAAEVERASGGGFVRIATLPAGSAPFWSDTTVFKKNSYRYRVRSVNQTGAGPYSAESVFRAQ